MAEPKEHFKDASGLLSLWGGVMLAPAAFLLNLQITYAVVTLNCSDAEPWLHLSSLATLLLALGGGWLAWREWRRTGEGWPGDGEGAVPRSRFLAVLGLLSSSLFALVILAQWLPVLVLGPCVQI